MPRKMADFSVKFLYRICYVSVWYHYGRHAYVHVHICVYYLYGLPFLPSNFCISYVVYMYVYFHIHIQYMYMYILYLWHNPDCFQYIEHDVSCPATDGGHSEVLH